MQRLHLLDPLDEVRLLQAAVTVLVPVTQDLLQVLDLQLLEVDCAEVYLLLICELAHLPVLLLQLLADLRGHS